MNFHRGHGLDQWLPSWTPSAELDAQSAHLAWGIAIILTVRLLWCYPNSWFTVRTGISRWADWLTLLAWVLVKEFVFDIIIERDSFLSSSLDASFYLLGGLLGVIIWKLSRIDADYD